MSRKFRAVLILCFACTSSLIFISLQNNSSKSRKADTIERNFPTSAKLVPDRDVGFSASIISTDSKDRFTSRVKSFNDVLSELRVWTWRKRGNKSVWNSNGQIYAANNSVNVVYGSVDNYLDFLVENYSQTVKTVALPWFTTPSSDTVKNSLEDFVNVVVQRYYQWTADEQLCRWLETPRTSQKTYNGTLNGKCKRDMAAAMNEQTMTFGLQNDESHPPRFVTSETRFLFHLHVYQDAIVTGVGDVITETTKLVFRTCKKDNSTSLQSTLEYSNLRIYEELYVISQFWGTAVYHRMAEVVPRLVIGLEFLRQNPDILIHATKTSTDGRLTELMRIFRLDPRRLVSGLVRAKIVYQPRSNMCGMANVAESQLASQLYAEHIRREWPDVAASPPNRLVLIKRTGSRRFAEQDAIEKVLQKVAADFNLTYTLFADNPTPSLNLTMQWFHGAALVVGPHGAGLSNLFFSRPGTFVIEGVCDIPHISLCFRRLAHILGHRWHGMMSNGECPAVVTVSPADIASAVRKQLLKRENLFKEAMSSQVS